MKDSRIWHNCWIREFLFWAVCKATYLQNSSLIYKTPSMNTKVLLLGCILPFIGFAAEEVSIKSSINRVTVFTLGAEVSREISMNIKTGENVLAFEGLSPILDEKSIQFTADGDLSIVSINYEIRYPESTSAQKLEAQALSKKLEDFQEQLREQNDILVVSKREEEILLANTDFDIWKDMNSVELKQGMDLVRTRLTEIKKIQRQARKQIDTINLERQKVINKLTEMRIEDAKPDGVLVVKLDAKRAFSTKGKITYVVADAGWEPYYDLRVEDISKPLRIEYKAKVYQKTGEKWDDVKITLSTGNPYESGQLPQLDPWFLNFISQGYYQNQNRPVTPQKGGFTGDFKGVIVDAKTGESLPFVNVVLMDQNRGVIGGSSTDIDGKFTVNANSPITIMEVSFVGYQTQTIYLNEQKRFQTIKMNESAEQLEEVVITYEAAKVERRVHSEDIVNMAVRDVSSVRAQSAGVTSSGKVFTNERYVDGVKVTGGSFTISQNPVNLKFEVEKPYDIPSDGEQYKVAITEHNKDANYLYRAVPKLNEHAFLTAELTDWEELNLMNGSAGIYLEGTYLGETFLNPEEASDTLAISLGKDENIVVMREAVQMKEGKKFLSSKVEEKFHYEIKVRNNKSAALSLEILDQFPVSANEEITVEREEASDGEVDSKTGLVTWKFTLQPKEEKKLDLKYNVRYPKGRMVNLK